MKNILISGGAGFIGSRLSERLNDLGYQVTILDNLSPQIHGIDPTASPTFKLIRKNRFRFINGSVTDRYSWEEAIENQDAIIHLAAETGTGQSMYSIEKYTNVNIQGTAILLDILTNQSHSVKKVIVASSRAIYGEGKYFCTSHGAVYPSFRDIKSLQLGDFECKCPVCNAELQLKATDELSKIHPSSLYGVTKQVQEEMTITIGKAIGLPTVALRYQNVYGPGQSLKNPYTGILSIFSTQMKNNHKINVFEDGRESRDFIFIDDVVDATILSLERESANYQAFNVGSGIPIDVMTIATLLRENYNSSVEVEITGNFRLGDIRHNYADLTKIKNVLDFEPKVTIENGLKLFCSWVDSQQVYEDNLQATIEEMKSKGLFG